MVIYYLHTPYWEGAPFLSENDAVQYAMKAELFCPHIVEFPCDTYELVPVCEAAPGGVIIYHVDYDEDDDIDEIYQVNGAV